MKLIEVLREIAAMTDPQDPDSYRSDDPQGCLETVYWKAKNAALAEDATPDLLAACEAAEHDLHKAMERLPKRFGDREDYQQCTALLAQLRAAIAKAKGGAA